MSDLVVVIPARGGSKRIVGKNIRPLAGKPLVHWAIDYARLLNPSKIIVSTDSDEVAGVVRHTGVEISYTFQHSDTTTVDEVAQFFYYAQPKSDTVLVVIQPTMIGDVVDNVNDMLAYLQQGGVSWVRLSGLRAARGPFVSWGDMRAINDSTLIDIDTMEGFAAAETLLHKDISIGIRYKSGEKQGWGHELRAKTLADALQDYDVDCRSEDVWRIEPRIHRDVWINDTGDSTEGYMTWLNVFGKTITIEDDGPGARLAHASINPFEDLKYAVLRPEFYNLPQYGVRDEVEDIMLSFGGQDNHGMLDFVTQAIHNHMPTPTSGIYEPIKGGMAASMLRADLLFCAGGQTLYEAIKVGVPTICIPALPTEGMRGHVSNKYGVINLGIGTSEFQVQAAFNRVAHDKMLREDMSRRMKSTTVGDGTIHIRRLIEDLCN